MLTADIILDFEQKLRDKSLTVKQFSTEYCDDLPSGSILALIGIATEHRLRIGQDCTVVEFSKEFPDIPTHSIQEAIVTSIDNFVESFCPVSYFLGTMPVTHGGYIFRKEIGRGGSGVVYEVEQIALRRNVAAKVLFMGNGKISDEAVLLGRIDHPGVLPVYDQGVMENHSFFVTKLIHGATLKQFCRKPPNLSIRRAITLAIQILDAVCECHARGIIHWDLKPSNILMSDEQPIVADFGLARHLGTAHSMTVGTPDYMAPEMFRKHDIISPIQCDLYSMGVILYELLTGNRPYNLSCESYDRPPRQPSELREDIDAELNQICLRAVSVSPASRFQTANQFRATLQTWLNSQTPEPEPQLSSGQTTTSENHDFDNDGATEKNLNPLWLKTAAGSTATVLAIAVFVIWLNFFR